MTTAIIGLGNIGKAIAASGEWRPRVPPLRPIGVCTDDASCDSRNSSNLDDECWDVSVHADSPLVLP